MCSNLDGVQKVEMKSLLECLGRQGLQEVLVKAGRRINQNAFGIEFSSYNKEKSVLNHGMFGPDPRRVQLPQMLHHNPQHSRYDRMQEL